VTVDPGITISAITNAGVPVLTFSGDNGLTPLSTATVSASTLITITITKGPVSSWYIDANGTERPHTGSLSPNTTVTFTAPPDLGFYNINVFATVGDIDYSGSFGLIVE
jgi:hypothetical protein